MRFGDVKVRDYLIKYINHLANLFNVKCGLFDVASKEFVYNIGDHCEDCPVKCDYLNTHLYGCYEAERWGGKYIYYCQRGFVYIAIAIAGNLNTVEFGVIAGPITMGEYEDSGWDAGGAHFETAKVNDLAEVLCAVFQNVRDIQASREKDVFLNDVYKARENAEAPKYPINLEKQLQNAIADGNESVSRELLNLYLGQIFFSSNGDLELIKSRVLELIVVLSRSAIEGGGDVGEIFLLNESNIKEVRGFETLENLSLWLNSVIKRYISYVFDFTDVKHADIIFKVGEYVKNNYAKKITLDDISGYVYLSKSYLSKIFKEEMNLSLTAFINNIRIEKSKSMLTDNSLPLVEVASLAGFEDQSYFNKVFKKTVGISPGKYRELRGRLQ